MGQIMERKLAAIMFTDIAGFTALSAQDENKALKILKIQESTLLPIIKEFKGTIHKEMGDGLLITFPAVTNALKCAIKIQKKTNKIENLDLRIGIHEGEITFQDGDVLGDDVNVASRIEPFAAIGGIAISGKVQQNISSLKDFKTKLIGRPKLKGVIQEVKVYCIISDGLPETNIKKVSAKLDENQKNIFLKTTIGVCLILTISLFLFFQNTKSKDTIPSIAILPLDNKGNPDDEFYAYGISSDLISDVTGAGDIRVASLKDIEKTDYANLSTEDLANKLMVKYIAQGSLWKRDSIFQLLMEVYNAHEKNLVWSENWQKEWKDLPAIKGEISTDILNFLNVTTKQNLTKSITKNVEAYEYYLKAKEKEGNLKNWDNDRSEIISLLENSLSLDKELIESKILLGDQYFHALWNKTNRLANVTVTFDESEELIFKKIKNIYFSALELAQQKNDLPLTAKVKRKIGNLYITKNEYNNALEYFNKSLEIAYNINDKNLMSSALKNIGYIYDRQEQYDKAEEKYHKVIEIYKSIDDKKQAANLLGRLGSIYTDLSNNAFHNSNPEKCKSFMHKAIDYREQALNITKYLNNASSQQIQDLIMQEAYN